MGQDVLHMAVVGLKFRMTSRVRDAQHLDELAFAQDGPQPVGHPSAVAPASVGVDMSVGI